MKALTSETELDYFLERLLRKESVGRRRKRFFLCSLLQLDRRNKRRKGFGNLLLTKSLIWAESSRVWERQIASLYYREDHCKAVPSLPVPWLGSCFSSPGCGVMLSWKALSDQLEKKGEWRFERHFFCSRAGVRNSDSLPRCCFTRDNLYPLISIERQGFE